MFQYILIFIILLFLWLKYSLGYWKRRGIDGPAPMLIFGNLYDFIISKKRHFGEIYHDIYKSYSSARYVGIYKMQTPALLIRDLELIKEIFVTKFNVFNKNDFPVDPKIDPLLAQNPFTVSGDDWKKVRGQISPLFAQNRIKYVVPYINEVAKKLLEYIETGPGSSSGEFDVKDMSAKFTVDIVAAFAFGLDGESFTNPNSEFRQITYNIFMPTFWNGVKQTLVLYIPSLSKIFQVPFVAANIDKKLRSILNQVIKERKENKIERSDLLQSLLEMEKKHGSAAFSEDVIVGHSLSFLTEGSETSSLAMSFMLYNLALNPDVQRKAQAEVDAVFSKTGGVITEEALLKLEYLETVLLETLRMNPPIFTMGKISLREHEFPPQYPNSNKSLKIEPETVCIIPLYAMHHDPEYFPNPEKFDPDRFSKENRDKIPKYAFQGFGEGPRMCLGQKYGIAQSKSGVATILYRYNVLTCSKTEVPIKISKSMFMLAAENGVWVKLAKRKN